MAEALSGVVDDNTVRYRLFPLIDSKDKDEIIVSLNDCISKYCAFLVNDLCQYIWHFQPFNLRPVVGDTDKHCIEGVTNFGENIEDEWFIVYLLYRLSNFDRNLVIQVEDSDGQFLLIETAEYLPKWIEPENSDNRVFIYRASLHIIPLKRGAIPVGTPAVERAVDAVRSFGHLSECDQQIQKCISARTQSYPSRIKEYHQKTHCYVPIGVAALLKHDPSLVSLAVNAFYYRTVDDLKVCQAMKYFPPESRVMSCVTLTRCLYAQLMAQSYKPDAKVGWNLPKNDSQSFKAHDLGMKLASGFEILVSHGLDYSFDNENNGDKYNFEDDIRWKKFHDSLTKNKYFGNEIEGSKKHNQLIAAAKDYFRKMIKDCKSEEFDTFKHYGSIALNCLRTLDIDESEFESEAKCLEEEDNDDWMTLNSDQLDSLLKEKFCESNESSNYSKLSAQIPESLKAFVNNEKSGIKGAECVKNAKQSKINFNEDAFGDALNSVLSLKLPNSDTDSSSSGMSDYSDNEESTDSEDAYDNDLINDKHRQSIEQMKAYLNAMDRQLAQTQVGLSFERKASENDDHHNNNEDDYKPVDVDLNALTNILESYNSEMGTPGPASALLSTIGIHLPNNEDNQ